MSFFSFLLRLQYLTQDDPRRSLRRSWGRAIPPSLPRKRRHQDKSDLGVEVNINRATKLMRTFANQTEALGRYRGKGEQKMTVEHVHVYKGGQAIVGQVSQKNTRSMRTTPVNDDEQE